MIKDNYNNEPTPPDTVAMINNHNIITMGVGLMSVDGL